MRFDRGQLVFADTRRFGTFNWYEAAEDAAPAGVEPLSSELTTRKLERMTHGSTQNA